MAKANFAKLNKIFTSRNISLSTKIRLNKCYIWSIFMYGCETWTLTVSVEKRIEAFEMWLYRRITRTSWKEKKTNQEILEKLNLTQTELLKTIKQRKLSYYGHIRRHETIQKKILEGKVNGKRSRGRKRKSWQQNIEEDASMKINECSKVALDRRRWKIMASNLWKEKEPR